MIKTNAVRVLDRLAINYELREYNVDPEDLSAETVAAKVGLPPEQVFKTLAGRGGRGPEWNLPSGNFRKSGFELQGARERGRGSEDRHGSFERSASPDRLHSRGSY